MASGDTLAVFVPANNEPPSAAYATLDTRNAHPVLNFDGTTDEEAVFTSILDRKYAGGGLTVNLWVGAASATSGTMRWQVGIERIQASTLDIDADSFAAFQSNGATAPGTSGMFLVCAVTFTDGAQMDSLAVGEPYRLKVRRDADGTSGTDDIASDCQLLTLEVKET
jgi:hypothetical protein